MIIWKSPTGHQFSDPTLAMVDALVRSPRVRLIWCFEASDFRRYAAMKAHDYETSPFVRQVVDGILNDAGFTQINRQPAA